METSEGLIPVNLALGGGGAKGFVHVGVIEELIAQGFEIKSIVGTSMGALVGALFAHGVGVMFRNLPVGERQQRSAGLVRAVLHAQDFRKFIDVSYLGGLFGHGALRGAVVEDWLVTKLLDFDTGKSVRFGNLGFDLTITVTDAATGTPRHLSPIQSPDTDVSRAVRASISIPVVFQDVTVTINGNEIRCWDGGTTGNCRFDLARQNDASRLTVASSVTYGGETRQLTGRFPLVRAVKAFNHMLDILLRRMEDTLAEALGPEVMKEVVIVRPKLAGVGTLDFRISRAKREMLARNGREAVREELARHAAAL